MFVEVVEYVNDEIFIGNRDDVWSWEHPVDQYTLLERRVNELKIQLTKAKVIIW